MTRELAATRVRILLKGYLQDYEFYRNSPPEAKAKLDDCWVEKVLAFIDDIQNGRPDSQ